MMKAQTRQTLQSRRNAFEARAAAKTVKQDARPFTFAFSGKTVMDPRVSHLRTKPQHVVLRPDELRLFGRVSLSVFPGQYVGMYYVTLKDGAVASLTPTDAVQYQRAPMVRFIGYYVIAWPIRRAQRLLSSVRRRFSNQ